MARYKRRCPGLVGGGCLYGPHNPRAELMAHRSLQRTPEALNLDVIKMETSEDLACTSRWNPDTSGWSTMFHMSADARLKPSKKTKKGLDHLTVFHAGTLSHSRGRMTSSTKISNQSICRCSKWVLPPVSVVVWVMHRHRWVTRVNDGLSVVWTPNGHNKPEEGGKSPPSHYFLLIPQNISKP